MKDRPYYRQRPSDGPNCKQPFCFKDPSGWFFATELEELVDCEPKKKRYRIESTQEYIGWAKGAEDLPTNIHVPYNCRKAMCGLILKTNHECLQDNYVFAMSRQSGAAASSADGNPPSAEVWIDQEIDKGKGCAKPCKGTDKAKGGGGGGGGWMNKAVDIMVPLMAGQVDAAVAKMFQTCAKFETCCWCVWRISEN